MPVNFINEPIISFTILLIAIFIVPPLFERLKLPGLVGLLLAGVLLGQNGLNLLNPKSETIKLLSDIGKIYLIVNTNILTIVGDDIAKVIIEQAQAFDLVVLRSVRYRTAGGLAVSEVTTQVINNLKCSIIMLGEPQ
ncbi:cation:proton antiporter domain-containing protein [Dolichospermum compactum]|uniref:Sodium/hydrogen exchanger n=1 Tax=Dolichospermum compactum NIES-806 TaxID=1973481 RepID=A0A1Z4UY09_9CYAN|nr:sodium/hydrogen exchanger [Dolichospermum compactum NIES-806]